MSKLFIVSSLVFIFLIQSVFAISNVQHFVNGNKITLTYQGTTPFWINIRGDQNIGQNGGYLWAKTYSNSFTYDMSFAINPSKKFYYGVKDTSWSDVNSFYLGSDQKNCLKNGVCFNNKILLIIQKGGDSFITWGSLHTSDKGEIVNDDEVTKYYSKTINNEADFLIAFKDWDSPPSWAYGIPIKRNISGIGVDGNYDQSSFYGTKGKLKQFLVMPNIKYVVDNHDSEVRIVELAHEIGHYWLAYLTKPEMSFSDGIHYPVCIYNEGFADPMKGLKWKRLSDNEFGGFEESTYNQLKDYKFSDLSLYLMGFIPEQDVTPVKIVRPSDGSSNCYQNYYINDNMFHIKGKLDEYPITEIVARYGKRYPIYEQSQKDFTIQFALVAHENSNITQKEADSFMNYIKNFEKHTPYLFSNKATIKINTIN